MVEVVVDKVVVMRVVVTGVVTGVVTDLLELVAWKYTVSCFLAPRS